MGVTYCFGGCFRSSVAGLFSNLPSFPNREPWHGQSQECSSLFQCSAHPKCGHRGRVGRSKLRVLSMSLDSSCLCSILRDGEKSAAYGLSLPQIKSLSSIADTNDQYIGMHISLQTGETRHLSIRFPNRIHLLQNPHPSNTVLHSFSHFSMENIPLLLQGHWENPCFLFCVSL